MEFSPHEVFENGDMRPKLIDDEEGDGSDLFYPRTHVAVTMLLVCKEEPELDVREPIAFATRERAIHESGIEPRISEAESTDSFKEYLLRNRHAITLWQRIERGQNEPLTPCAGTRSRGCRAPGEIIRRWRSE